MIVVFFPVGMRTVFLFERAGMARYTDRHSGITLRCVLLRYALAAVAVVSAGTWLPFPGAELAQAIGWHNTFVGTIPVALATSVPELSVTIAAQRYRPSGRVFRTVGWASLFLFCFWALNTSVLFPYVE